MLRIDYIVGTTYTDVGGKSTAYFVFEDESGFFRCAAKYWIPCVRSNPSAKDFAIVYMCKRPNGQIVTKYLYRIATGDEEVVHNPFYFWIYIALTNNY